jgi:hypothetical protein
MLSLNDVNFPHKCSCLISSGEAEVKDTAGMPPGLLPIHKSSIVMFLERVYGVDSQETFFRLLEEGFLPDMRAAVSLDTVSGINRNLSIYDFLSSDVKKAVLIICLTKVLLEIFCSFHYFWWK